MAPGVFALILGEVIDNAHVQAKTAKESGWLKTLSKMPVFHTIHNIEYMERNANNPDS